MAQKHTQPDNSIKAVCFTGHREIEISSAYLIPSALKNVLKELILRGAQRFLAGGAIGFDTIAALCVLELKAQYPHIKLELILPCRNQTQKWNDLNKDVYSAILERADKVTYLHDSYTASCMHDRNRRLVDEADVVIAYLAHSGGGTAYTAAYALKQKRELINVYDLIQ
ncbi:MAG: DUF1273 domain-containing protein [Ruminococcaceae bacterium]|nr:DUF1273 domain-containing protein [Oscillospiraceae bacterium]